MTEESHSLCPVVSEFVFILQKNCVKILIFSKKGLAVQYFLWYYNIRRWGTRKMPQRRMRQ